MLPNTPDNDKVVPVNVSDKAVSLRAPLMTNGIAEMVVTGGHHMVDPNAIVIEVILNVLSGAVEYAHSKGNAGCIVYAALDADAENAPELGSVSMSTTVAFVDSADVQP